MCTSSETSSRISGKQFVHMDHNSPITENWGRDLNELLAPHKIIPRFSDFQMMELFIVHS